MLQPRDTWLKPQRQLNGGSPACCSAAATAARVERRRPRAVRSAPGLRAAAARRERQEDLDGGAPDGPLLAFALAPTCSHCKCWCSLLGWWCWRRAGSAIRLSCSSSSPSCATRSAWRAGWSVATAAASICRCCGRCGEGRRASAWSTCRCGSEWQRAAATECGAQRAAPCSSAAAHPQSSAGSPLRPQATAPRSAAP